MSLTADDLKNPAISVEGMKAAADEDLLNLLIVRERRRRRAKQIVDAEERPPRAPLRPLTITELFDRRGADYLVDELLPEGALAEIVGDSESLKSFFAIDLGLCIAANRPDFFGLKVVKHGAVLYIAAEGEGAFQYRVRAWGQSKGVDLSMVPFSTIAAPVDLRDPTFQEELQAVVSQLRPVLIIVDTLHRCMPGSEENSARDLGEVVAFATRLKVEYETAVLFLHHPPKATPNGRGRGSSALYYAADTELSAVILPGSEQANGVKVVEFKVKKQKDDAKVTLALMNQIVPVLNQHGRPMAYASGRPINSCILVPAGDVDSLKAAVVEEAVSQIIEYVRTHPSCTKNAVHAKIGGNKKKVLAQINALIDTGDLATDSRDRLIVPQLGLLADGM